MASSKTQRTHRPLGSYILRVLEQRVVTVSAVYELHDIAAGTRQQFSSLAALQRFLAQEQRRAR